MFDQQVVDYIKKALASGQTKEQITSALLGNGWSEAEVAENFAEASPVQQPQPSATQQPASQSAQAEIQPAQQPQPEQSTEPKDNLSAEPIQPIQPQPQQPMQPIRPAQPEPRPSQQPQQQPVQQTTTEPISNLDAGLGMKRETTPAQPSYTPNFDPNAGKPQQSELRQGESVYQFQHQDKPQKSDQKTSRIVGLLISLAVVIMILGFGGAAFYYFDLGTYLKNIFTPIVVQQSETTPGQSENQTATTIFGQYLENTSYSAQIPEYTLLLSDITNISNFESTLGQSLSDNQKSALINDNFFIAKNYDTDFYSTDTAAQVERNDDWTGLYKKIGGSASQAQRQPDNAVFISSDYLTHVYHKLVENEFSYIEELKLYPVLASLSNSMLANFSAAASSDALQQDSYNRLTAYFLISSAILNNASADYQTFSQNNYIADSATDTKANALALVDSLATQYKISDAVKYTAKQEITLIFDASKYSSSPLLGKYQSDTLEDYTQYSPRSHYAKNVILRDYFRAMMWFGRTNFLTKSTELTRDAANIVLSMDNAQIAQWKSIYEPTSFFVGKADDLTIDDIKTAIADINFSANNESDDAVSNLQIELQNYSNPSIMSSVIVSESVPATSKEDLLNSTKGFRFMGQRFTPDAFIFSSLTQGEEAVDPATGQKLPSTPTALMVSTLMGDVVSKDLLNSWIATNAPNSDKVIASKMDELQNYFDSVTDEQWTSNIYWSWIYTIKSLFTSEKDKTGYPMFLKNSNWDTKSTQSFLGSWTELKHDTLLYAKQSYAERGGGGEEQEIPAVPKGYVEPNIEFLDRLIALVKTTNKGLTDYNLMPDSFQSQNSSFVESLEFFKALAVAELANQTISDDDFEKLRTSAYTLDQLLYAPDSQVQLESNARSAIIADVHTDTVKSQILYEADGIPNYIYVAIKDANGTRLTKGLVYSYYEFTNPLGKRLDDATWQKWNYSSTIKLLKMPDWNTSLIK